MAMADMSTGPDMSAGNSASDRGTPHRMFPGRASGFSLIEILIVVAIIATLVGLLLPAVQSARETARRTSCMSNLRQIGIGLHSFHSARGFFPTAVSGSGVCHYWTAQMLPYLEENPLAGIYDYTVAFKDIKNREAVQVSPRFTRCPSTPGGPLQHPKFKTGTPAWGAAATDYAGSDGPSSTLWTAPAVISFPLPGSIDGFMKGGVKPGEKGWRIGRITDGTAKSIAVFEAAGRPQVWAFGGMIADSGLAASPSGKYVLLCGWADPNQVAVKGFRQDRSQADPANQCKSPGPQLVNGSNNSGIYAFHSCGANVLFADGSTRFLDDTMSADVVAALLTVQAADMAVVP